MQSKIIASNLPDNIQVTTVKSQDFSKHPPPCQKYLQNIIGKITFSADYYLKYYNSQKSTKIYQDDCDTL